MQPHFDLEINAKEKYGGGTFTEAEFLKGQYPWGFWA
jgi:hypothetical protein